MKIAALQMVSTSRVEENLATAERLVAQAAHAGARLVALPEYFCLMGQDDRDKLRIAEPAGSGPIQRALAECARAHGIWLVGGTVPIRTDRDDRALNACCMFGPDGRQLARYDKIHLFCYDNGRERYDEGRTLQGGRRPVAVALAGAEPPLRVGLSICYDLRFPELYRALMEPPCDVIAVPAAFTYTTGRAHWEILLRARAIENQCYVIAAAQGGRHENGRRTWGHSLVIDPWGEILACCEEGEGMAIADLDAGRLSAVRTQLPALTHRATYDPTLSA
jgi:predicted amidohydrolase